MTKIAFVFLLTVYGPERTSVYAMDTGISGEDCIAAMEQYNETFPQWDFGNPSCEIDMELNR